MFVLFLLVFVCYLLWNVCLTFVWDGRAGGARGGGRRWPIVRPSPVWGGVIVSVGRGESHLVCHLLMVLGVHVVKHTTPCHVHLEHTQTCHSWLCQHTVIWVDRNVSLLSVCQHTVIWTHTDVSLLSVCHTTVIWVETDVSQMYLFVTTLSSGKGE